MNNSVLDKPSTEELFLRKSGTSSICIGLALLMFVIYDTLVSYENWYQVQYIAMVFGIICAVSFIIIIYQKNQLAEQLSKETLSNDNLTDEYFNYLRNKAFKKTFRSMVLVVILLFIVSLRFSISFISAHSCFALVLACMGMLYGIHIIHWMNGSFSVSDNEEEPSKHQLEYYENLRNMVFSFIGALVLLLSPITEWLERYFPSFPWDQLHLLIIIVVGLLGFYLLIFKGVVRLVKSKNSKLIDKKCTNYVDDKPENSTKSSGLIPILILVYILNYSIFQSSIASIAIGIALLTYAIRLFLLLREDNE